MKLYFFVLTFALGINNLNAQNFDEELWIPPTIEGPVYNLDLASSSKQFFDGVDTETYGINGDYLGPTIIMNKGEFIELNVMNSLDENATMHWHGMHVAPEHDGGPMAIISPETTWSPSFEVMDFATTFWYHPHLHMNTTRQVNMGAAGMIIVKDQNEAELNLPRNYGVDDFPLILQGKSFDEDKQIQIFNHDTDLMVNGTLDPYLECPAQVIRFRILNASSMRIFNLGLSNNMTFHQIGSDGGLLQHPVSLTRLMLSPGERAEVLIDFTGQENQTIDLRTYASEIAAGIPGGPGNGVLDGLDLSFMEFRVENSHTGGCYTIEQNLENHQPWNINNVAVERQLTMTGPPFYFDDTNFSMATVNHVVHLGDTEIWEIVNLTGVAHPFHIHDVQFFILDINGEVPPLNLQGRKDVVLIEPWDTVRFITKFEDFADPDIPYMYHCHLLPHEDFGMMGQFVVIDVPCETQAELQTDQTGIACHESRNWIKAEATISAEASIEYSASDYVELKPGFAVEAGANFEIILEGCGQPNGGGSGGDGHGGGGH